MFSFSLEVRPNIYGMHEEGDITIYLSNFNYSSEEMIINKVCHIIWHESIHKAIHGIEEGIEWQKQDKIIGLLELKLRN